MAVFQTRSAARHGLTLSDLQAVDILARETTVCASELADECGLTRGAITGMLNRLERAGVARREKDGGDGRKLVISAIADPSGCDCRVPQAFRDVAASFDEKALHAIRQFLDQSASALRREAESMQKQDEPAPRRAKRRAARRLA
jgi:predicted transcriptional regulator